MDDLKDSKQFQLIQSVVSKLIGVKADRLQLCMMYTYLCGLGTKAA